MEMYDYVSPEMQVTSMDIESELLNSSAPDFNAGWIFNFDGGIGNE